MSPDQPQSVSLNQAGATWESDQLTLTTGSITRQYRLVRGGLATGQLRDEQRNIDWIAAAGGKPGTFAWLAYRAE
jgi:hypothetical protein